MSRDVNQLRVFALAHALTLDVYRHSSTFPPEERYGLQTQIRRAAVSVPSNVVEGAARRTTADWYRFLEIAMGSASEARYLIRLSKDLGFVDTIASADCVDRDDHLARSLQKMLQALRPLDRAR